MAERTPVDEAFRRHMRAVAEGLDVIFNGPLERRPRPVGFALFTFNFDRFHDGQVNFVSNAERATMIAAVEEWLKRAKQGEGPMHLPVAPLDS